MFVSSQVLMWFPNSAILDGAEPSVMTVLEAEPPSAIVPVIALPRPSIMISVAASYLPVVAPALALGNAVTTMEADAGTAAIPLLFP